MKKQKQKNRRKFIAAVINGIQTRIYLRNDSEGGRFYTSKSGSKVIEVSRYDSWPGTVGVLLHEVTELAAAYLGLRLFKNRVHTGSDAACFFWTHEEFSEVMAEAGEVMARILPEFSELYEEAAPEKGKKK